MRNKYINDLYYKELTFLEGYESFCYQNCQRILLESQGLKNPELYINTALSFNYNKINDDIYSVYGSRSLLPSLETYVKRLYFDDNLDLVTEIFMQNIDYLDKNELPIIVGVDTFYLEYAINFQKNHAIHTLIMCGYDLDKNEVYVIDWYKPWYFKGVVKLEDFLKARNSLNPYDGTMFSGTPIKNNWAFIEKLKSNTFQELFLELLNTTIKNYMEDNEDESTFRGVEAFNAVKNRLLESNDFILYKNFYLKLLNISKRYKLFNESLISYEKIKNSNELKDLRQFVKYQINNWDKLLMVILKGSMKLTDKTKKRIEENFEILIQNEKLIKVSIEKLQKKELCNEHN